MRHAHVRVVLVCRGEGLLGLGLEPVVQLLDHAPLELLEDGLDVDARDPRGRDPSDPGDLVEVAQQCLAGPWVLDLDGDRSPVTPHRAMHLADRGSGGRVVLERGEHRAPGASQLGAQDVVRRSGVHRRGVLLQLGEDLPVRSGDIFREGASKIDRAWPNFMAPPLS